MKKNSQLVTFLGNPMTLLGEQVKVGDKAQNFSAIGVDLKPVDLASFKGSVKIVSAVPSVDTGICALQTKRFNQEAANLKDVNIITISCDLPFAMKRFCGAEGIEKVVTVSDHKEIDFSSKYGLLIEELRLTARAVIVIDKDDVVRYVEIVKEIASEPDYDKALEVVKTII
jgi:thiol peroxidase